MQGHTDCQVHTKAHVYTWAHMHIHAHVSKSSHTRTWPVPAEARPTLATRLRHAGSFQNLTAEGSWGSDEIKVSSIVSPEMQGTDPSRHAVTTAEKLRPK